MKELLLARAALVDYLLSSASESLSPPNWRSEFQFRMADGLAETGG